MKTVAILLATYKPNPIFFEQQLKSINQQDYPQCHLYVRDDSQDDDWFSRIQQMVSQFVDTMPVTFFQNPVNLGSNQTFEQLTKEAGGDYFAYCDQDDVWHTNKITRLVEHLEETNAVMCYSDLSVINSDNQLLFSSFTQYNRRVKHVYGQQAFAYFIRRNSVTGCTMLIKKTIAQMAIPFHPDYVHDHWLALFAASKGEVAYVSEPLIDYRIHGNNQIGKAVLEHIKTVDDYIPQKLLPEKEKFTSLVSRLTLADALATLVTNELQFVDSRIQAFKTRKIGDVYRLWRWRYKDKTLVYLEVILTLFPKWLGNSLLKRIKK